MKARYLSVILAVVALTLASACNPCQAGSITYDFVEGTGAPHPGEIGATITLLSPPALDSSAWSLSSVSDVSSLQIIDNVLFNDGFTGSFSVATISTPLSSTDGSVITSGVVIDTTATHFIQISPTNTQFEAYPINFFVPGSWNIQPSSVPEPATAVHAGFAIAIGLGLAAFRRRKGARRQLPVGPLDANQ